MREPSWSLPFRSSAFLPLLPPAHLTQPRWPASRGSHKQYTSSARVDQSTPTTTTPPPPRLPTRSALPNLPPLPHPPTTSGHSQALPTPPLRLSLHPSAVSVRRGRAHRSPAAARPYHETATTSSPCSAEHRGRSVRLWTAIGRVSSGSGRARSGGWRSSRVALPTPSHPHGRGRRGTAQQTMARERGGPTQSSEPVICRPPRPNSFLPSPPSTSPPAPTSGPSSPSHPSSHSRITSSTARTLTTFTVYQRTSRVSSRKRRRRSAGMARPPRRAG